jgi:hypothetical protein
VEWVAVSDDIAIVARETGEFWVVELNDKQTNPFAQPMTGEGARGSTAGLLNTAVALGLTAGGDLKPRAPSLPRYALDLVFSYHNARRAPGHFRNAAKRFEELGRPNIASYFETHAREETGHDRLALKDLRALGLPAEKIVANLVPKWMKPLVEFHDHLAASNYPIGCIGYSYCFEYTAALKGKPEVDAVAALCPPGIDASRFLRTHSGLGSEAGHVDDIVDFVASLRASDRTEIVKATYQTAVKLGDGVRFDARLSDSQISAELEAAAGEKIRLGAEANRHFASA